MVPDFTRRRALRCGGVALAATLAGCSGDGATPTPTDPDAGTDSYGILLDNGSPLRLSIDLAVEKPSGDEPLWETTASIEGKSQRTWDSVVTAGEKQLVKARLLDQTDSETYDVQQAFATLRITPGSEEAPDVPNVVVYVTYEKQSEYAEKYDLNVAIPLPGQTPRDRP